MAGPSGAGLETYNEKRDFTQTAEPRGRKARKAGRSFVIQKHAATRLHYDLRLEMDGVLKSWAVTKGPSLVAGEKRLAVHVEDHPLDYGTFEGTIAKGEYGAGEVTIWDSGTYDVEKWRDGKEVIAVLHGEQRGTRRVALIHTGHGGGKAEQNWLIHRMKDDDAGGADGGSSGGHGTTTAKSAPST